MENEDGAEVSNDPRLRPEAVRQAAGFVANLYAIDVTLDGNRSVPLSEYARILGMRSSDRPQRAPGRPPSGRQEFD